MGDRNWKHLRFLCLDDLINVDGPILTSQWYYILDLHILCQYPVTRLFLAILSVKYFITVYQILDWLVLLTTIWSAFGSIQLLNNQQRSFSVIYINAHIICFPFASDCVLSLTMINQSLVVSIKMPFFQLKKDRCWIQYKSVSWLLTIICNCKIFHVFSHM